MGSYGKMLPVTGTALVIGGTAVPYPYVAVAAAAVIIVGLLVLRLVRPAKLPRR
jgi:hypothetical protein